MKQIIKAILILIITTALINPVYAENAVIYEYREEQILTKGVAYAKTRQITAAGMRDIYTLTIDITDPFITVTPAESANEYSLKESLTSLLAASGAVAGVNGDFFGMAGVRSASFGPVIKNSSLVSVNSAINAGASEYGSFFITNDNNPFITFIKANVSFYNNGVKNIDVHSLNKITDMVRPVAVTTAAMSDTALLDARFKGLYKIVVADDKIVRISEKGEVVTVPENGFIIVMNERFANDCLFNFHEGERGILQVSSWVNLENIKTAIGGGGRILKDGELSTDGMTVSGNTRQPRTAVGITQDKKKIILTAVDGRTHSVGATHDEMADIMKRQGAYDAMHLDGGGSTTMAVKYPGEKTPFVVNRVSDGQQRRVINALGVYNNAPAGDLSQFVVAAGDKNIVYAKAGVELDIYGTDAYLRRVSIDKSEALLTHNDPNGFFANGMFYPQSIGEITVLGVYNNLSAEVKLKCRELKEIRPNVSNIKAMEGDAVALSFTGIDQTGEENKITSGITYTVVPAGAGVVESGHFIPKLSVDGYIECALAGVKCYIGFQIGGDLTTIEPLEGGRKITFESNPESVSGSVAYTLEPIIKGAWSAKLYYQIPESDATQAAYLVFDGGVPITGEPMAIRMSVYGNMSGLWLRGRIIDANGEQFSIDFAGDINWEGWRTVNASIPAGVAYPITLDRLYVVTLQSVQGQEGGIYFGDIEAVYPRADANILLPQTERFADPLRVTLGDSIAADGYDITVLGRTAPSGEKPAVYNQTIEKITEIITKNTKRSLYIGQTEMPTDIGIAVYKWNENYTRHYDENAAIIQMGASGGGITRHNPWQWESFPKDIKQSGKKNVIIMLDKNPLYFAEPRETQLFCDALAELKEQGLNVYVVSAEGTGTAVQLINGVRYINLGTLWNEDGSINPNFRVLRFRVSGGEMRYELRGL